MKWSYFSIIFVALFFFSCGDELNLDNPQAIPSDVALSNDQGVKTALVGAYEALASPGLWGGNCQIINELLADDTDQFVFNIFGNITEMDQKNVRTLNGDVLWNWENSYSAIDRCNNVLASLDAVDNEDRLRVESEARFIRGSVYFELVNLFSKTWIDGDPATNPGVPIKTEPTLQIDDDLLISRSSVADAYDLAISDLLFAKNNLPSRNGFFATTYAASGILSRIYLMQEEFVKAREEAERIIGSGMFSLVSDVNFVFNQPVNTSEHVFAIQKTSMEDFNRLIGIYSGQNEGGNGVISITDEHIAKYEEGDLRGAFFYFDNFGLRRTGKWRRDEILDGNIGIVRIAEIYLTRAECNFRLGNIEAAASDLNIIRSRAGLPEITASELNLDKILEERALELAFEGHMFRDIKRNRKSVGDIPFDSDRLVLPIPQRELDLNPNLAQNPGY